MAIKPKPNGKCFCCNSEKWWWNERAQNWNCGVCHPNPRPETYMEPVDPARTPLTRAPGLKVDSARAFETQAGEEKAAFAVYQRGLEQVEAQEKPVPPDNPGNIPSTVAPSLKVDPGPLAAPSEAQVGEAEEPVGPQEKPVVFERTEESLALLRRVREGNLKLIKAWPQIIRNPSDAEFARLSLEFYQAKEKLEGLCRELQARGYRDCLYIENGVKTQRCDSWPNSQMCKVCPSEIDYFAAELFGGEPPMRHNSPQKEKQGEVVMEFLKTLGGKI